MFGDNDEMNQEISTQAVVEVLTRMGAIYRGCNDHLGIMKFDIPETCILHDNKDHLKYIAWTVNRITPYKLAVRRMGEVKAKPETSDRPKMAFEDEINEMIRDVTHSRSLGINDAEFIRLRDIARRANERVSTLHGELQSICTCTDTRIEHDYRRGG
jgi:hypothetical protein